MKALVRKTQIEKRIPGDQKVVFDSGNEVRLLAVYGSGRRNKGRESVAVGISGIQQAKYSNGIPGVGAELQFEQIVGAPRRIGVCSGGLLLDDVQIIFALMRGIEPELVSDDGPGKRP